MAGIRTWIGGMIVAALFIFLMLMFSLQMRMTNTVGGEQELLQDPTFNETFVDLNDSLTRISDSSNGWYQATVNNTTPDIIQIFLIFPSIVGMTYTIMTSAVSIFKTSLGFVFQTLLGTEGGIVFGVIMAIILISLIFLSYKFFRTGEGDR